MCRLSVLTVEYVIINKGLLLLIPWKHIVVCELLVFDRNTCNHKTGYARRKK